MIGLFRAKYITFDLKKNRGVIFHDTYDMRNLANFHQSTWKCQNWYFHGILLSTIENAWAKNLREMTWVLWNDTDEWRKIWRGIDSSFQNGYEELDEFSPRHSKLSKICTLMGCFRKYKGAIFRDTREWCKIWKQSEV